MQYIPHDYQAYCIQRVVEDPAVGLFLRPGLGKTSITLSAINILKYFRWQVSRVLVVAPKKVAEATWQKEAARWEHLRHLRVSTVLGERAQAHPGPEHPSGCVRRQPGECGVAGGLLPAGLALRHGGAGRKHQL